MADRRTVDPRFDPRFQRGYDPATAPPPPPSYPRPIDETPVPVPPARPVPPAEIVTGSARASFDADADGAQDAAAEDFGEEFEPAPGRNPFRLALLLVSIGFLALAVGLLSWQFANQSQFIYGSAVETAAGWMVQQLAQVAPPAATIAGFVGLAAWLGLGALDAQRRSAAPRSALPDEADDE